MIVSFMTDYFENKEFFNKNMKSNWFTEINRFLSTSPFITKLVFNKTYFMKQDKVDRLYLRMAFIWSENSYAVRRQVGCLIVKRITQ